MKNIIKKAIVGLSATMLLAIGSTGIVSANNHNDTKWSFSLGRIESTSYTTSRLKTDKSRSYAKLKQIGLGRAHVWTVRANGANIDTGSYNIKQGQSVKIFNRAYEKYGRTHIKLGVHTESPQVVHVHASGVWSPDSI